jgi:tetratricopeptide (TPR) repeat protein
LKRAKGEKEIAALASLHETAGAPLRRSIVSILAGAPTQLSIEALRTLRPGSWRTRFRYSFAWLHFGIGLWPKTMMLVALLATPLVLTLFVAGWSTIMYPERLFVRKIENGTSLERARWATALAHAMPESKDGVAILSEALVGGNPLDLQQAAIEGLSHIALGAGGSNSEGAVRGLARGIGRVPASLQITIVQSLVGTAKRGGTEAQSAVAALADATSCDDGDVRLEVLTGFREVAVASASLISDELIRGKLLPFLTKPSNELNERNAVVQILQHTRSPAAVDTLHQFVTAPSLRDPAKRSTYLEEEDLRRSAVEALLLMGTPQAYLALVRLRDSTDLSRTLRSQAEEAAQQIQPLAVIERSFRDGRYREVVEIGEELRRLERDPETREILGLRDSRRLHWFLARGYANWANQLQADGQTGEALAALETGLAMDSEYAFAHAVKGWVHYKRYEYPEALASLRRATDLDPNDSGSYLLQARIQLDQGEPETAESLALTGIKLDPNNSWGFQLLRESYHAREEHDLAVSTFQQLKKSYPDNVWPVLGLMFIYQEYVSMDDDAAFTHAYEEASSIYRKRSEHVDTFFLANYVEICLTSGHFSEAAKLGRETVERIQSERELSPLSGVQPALEFLVYLGYVMQNRYGEARDQLTRLERAVSATGMAPESWEFSGTRRFIDRSSITPRLKAPTLDLIDMLEDGDLERLEEILTIHRAALESAGSQPIRLPAAS